MKSIEVRLEGQLDLLWKEWLGDELTICYVEGDQTVLTGTVPDQAALYGLIAKLRDLGVKLVSVNFEDVLPG